jgi:lysophospholipase L1-like esterase
MLGSVRAMRRLIRSFAALAMLLIASVALGTAQPAAGQELATNRVFLVGDSVLASLAPPVSNRAQTVIAAAGFQVTIDAQVCRRSTTTGCTPPSSAANPARTPPDSALSVIEANPSMIGGVVVVMIGHNDNKATGFAAKVDTLLDALGPTTQVVWLTMNEVDSSYVTGNRTLRAAAAARTNVSILDWAAAVKDQPRWTLSDGIHLTNSGADGIAALIRNRLLEMPTPRGSCGVATNPPSSPSGDSARGYWLLDSTGKVWPYGQAVSHGDLVTKKVTTAPASFQATPTGLGYWIVDRNGVVHAFGDAGSFGDMSGQRLNGPVRRIEAAAAANGYWLVASDGGVFSFNVPFLGSMGGTRLNQPVISMSSTPTGLGYWLVASDGGVFGFGDAVFHGSTGAMLLNQPVISMAVAPDGSGYWLYARDGGVFSFGVPFHGSVPGLGLCDRPTTVAMRPSATGLGYWVVSDTGRVFPFGDAVDLGGLPPLLTGVKVIDMAVMR